MTKEKPNFNRILLVVIVILLVVSNVVTFYIVYDKLYADKDPIVTDEDQDNIAIADDSVIEDTSDETSRDVPLTEAEMEELMDEDAEDADKEDEADEEESVLDSFDLAVGWQDPVKINSNEFFNDKELRDKIASNENLNNWNMTVSDFINSFEVYRTGTIKTGVFKNQKLYVAIYYPEMAHRLPMFRVIKNANNKLIRLSEYSDNTDWLAVDNIFIDNDTVRLTNLEPKNLITIPNTKYVLKKSSEEPLRWFSDYGDVKQLFKYNGSDYIYKSEDAGCFVVKANDGTAREYYYQIDLILNKGEKSEFSGLTPYILNFNYNDGTSNKGEYFYKSIGGCGAYGCYNYNSDLEGELALAQVGVSGSGEKVYKQEDGNSEDLQEMYEMYYPGWDSVNNTQLPKESFEDFLSSYPLLYWIDPFGDILEFRNAKYIPAVECGKPVIYLYPEEEINVSVQVNPAGGFTITEPAYNEGWNVKATPESELYNYADGQTYPYLFWEGYGLNYEIGEQGWVVPVYEVEQFVKEKLLLLGLVDKEIDEFVEFWVPRMQSKPYYFITFMDQSEFDQLAPLNVQPQPDKVIRVFMDFKGSDYFYPVEPQTIITPEREGFTVVEWGGALHD